MKTLDTFRLSLSHVKKQDAKLAHYNRYCYRSGCGRSYYLHRTGYAGERGGSPGQSWSRSDHCHSWFFTGKCGFEGGRSAGSATINLTDKDVNVIKQVPGVLYVNGMVSGRSDMIMGTEKASVSITGVDPVVWRSMVTTELESGRYLQPGDSNAVVIGYSLAHETFLQPITLNRPITIGGKTFKVVGIFVQSGGGFGGGGDNAVYMPVDYARDVITTNVSRNTFTSIMVKVADPTQADKIATDIITKLMPSRHVNSRTRDFTVTAFATIQQQITSVVQTISLFLAAIAAVSLLVGAVGIANTMFMSVMERTRQIGLLKALGATDGEVMKLFLMESGLFGFVGGVLGIVCGILISVIISAVGMRAIGRAGQ